MIAPSSRSRPLALVIALATFTAPVTGPIAAATAQPLPAGDRVTRARELTEQGLDHYQAGDGGRALAAFRAAYELVPVNELLLNLGLAAERADQAAVAIDYLERFLAVERRDPRRAEIHAKIAALREALAAAEARRRDEEAARRAELERAADEARRRDQAWTEQRARERALHDRRAEEAGRRAALERRGRGLRLGGLALAGTGALALGAAAYFGHRASALSDELSETGAQFDPAKVEAGQAADRNLIVSLVAGGVLLGAGVTLHVIGRRQRARAHLTVSSTREGVGLSWAGSF